MSPTLYPPACFKFKFFITFTHITIFGNILFWLSDVLNGRIIPSFRTVIKVI
jgi:hypothetical protein